MHDTHSYIRTQATISAIINMIANPAISWLVNRDMQATPLTGVAVDTTITCLVMSTLIALFTTSALERALKSGSIKAHDDAPRAGMLSRLPHAWWALGPSLGFGFALVLVPLSVGFFALLGLSELPFRGFAVLKILYPGAMAFAVTRWVIVRQLQAAARLSSVPS
jgi:uncharacterized BrkB/YihY/UPF0761 family membrane protein